MSLVDLLLSAEAAQAQRAVRRTVYRHQHLAEEPLVVTCYNLSGEAAAPLGILYGTDRDPAKAKLVVSAEPRNRDSRFAAINRFAADLVEYVRPFLALHEETRKGITRQVASEAPQIVAPNRATRSYLGGRLGRSLRYLGLGDTHEVPEATQWAGAHLSWFAEHSHLPGQSTFLAMSESLSEHFATGQSALEDENLATLLAWIDGVPGNLLDELEVLEERAFGPVPNPKWEASLEPFVKAYTVGLRDGDPDKSQQAFDHVAREVRVALAEAYAATHHALEILRGISPAVGVERRWKIDLYDWSDHARRCTRGIPRFARRDDALRAAQKLQRWSSAAEELEIDQCFDDPLIMARLDAQGRCLTGQVSSLDLDNREVKPGGKNRTSVPLIELKLIAPTRLLAGETVRWTADRRVRAVIREVDDGSALLAVIGGPKVFSDAPVGAGDRMMLAGLDPWGGMDPWGPDEIPWTHRESTSDLGDEEVRSIEPPNGDDSPDMSTEELASLPTVGIVAPDEVSGVVL